MVDAKNYDPFSGNYAHLELKVTHPSLPTESRVGPMVRPESYWF